MLVAGCDIGSLTGKAVIWGKNGLVASCVIPRKPLPEDTALLALDNVLERSNLRPEDICYTVGTGYGRRKISFANAEISEISCHGKGVHLLAPSVRTIIDIGGQDSKAISINEKGNVTEFVMNDKCAAGTGRFLEVISQALGLELDQFALEALKSKNPLPISSQCTVFAESEVITLLAESGNLTNIVAGIHKSICNRIAALVKRLGFKKDFTLTGGVAKNPAIVRIMEEEFGDMMKIPCDPQIVGALGAALFAAERVER